jgi:hypothetical protein
VGLTHARRGNAAGAVTLLRRGTAAVAGYRVPPGELPGPAGLDLHAVLAAATALADQIAARGLDAVPPDQLKVPIAAGPG